MNWIIILLIAGLAYFVYKNRRKKKEPEKTFVYPATPLFVFYLSVVRPSLKMFGEGDLGADEIKFFGYNATRMGLRSPWNVYHRDEQSHGHWWQKTAGMFRTTDDGWIYVIKDEKGDWAWDKGFIGNLKMWVRALYNRGIVVTISLFDACTLKYSSGSVGHEAWPDRNNMGWDGSSTEKFLKVNGLFWEMQKAVVRKVLEEVGMFGNVNLQLCNEPYPTRAGVKEWHRELMAYAVATKTELGYHHVKININASWDEMNHLAPEYIEIHDRRWEVERVDDIVAKINPHGFGNLNGKAIVSTDVGVHKEGYDHYPTLVRCLEKGASYELLDLDKGKGHEAMRRFAKEYLGHEKQEGGKR